MNISPIQGQKWDVDSVEKAINAFACELESEDSTDESQGEVSSLKLSANLSSNDSEKLNESNSSCAESNGTTVKGQSICEASQIESIGEGHKTEAKVSLTSFLRTKKGNFKSFDFTVDDQMVRLTRPDSSKQHEFTYELSTVQCIIG